MALTLPPLQSPAVEPATGLLTTGWIGFFRDLLSRPGPIIGIAATGSPFVWSAPSNGALSVSGGAVTAIQITRGRVTITLGITQGIVPVSQGDVVHVTYTGAPAINFIPRGL